MTFLFVSSMAFAPFVGFHLYLVSTGMTTNEYYKRKELTGPNGNQQSRIGNLGAEESLQFPHDQHFASGNRTRTGTICRLTNVYDLGVVANFLEVMHPRSLQDKRQHQE